MAIRAPQTTETVAYGCPLSYLLLWQKSIVLLPIWLVPVLPIAGLLFHCAGILGLQIGFGALLSFSFFYLFQDLLKRKISMDDENLFFGFRTVPIAQITSIDVTYRKGMFLPRSLELSCENGKKLSFLLDRLSEKGVETLLKHLHSKNSRLKAAVVLNTLVKCRTTRRKLLDQSTKLEVGYESRQLLWQTLEGFKSAAAKWKRIGPMAMCVCAIPTWLSATSYLYLALEPEAFRREEPLYISKFQHACAALVNWWMGTFFRKTSQNVQDFIENPMVTMVATAAVLSALAYVLHCLARPNRLCISDKDISLIVRLGDFTLPVRSVNFEDIVSVKLHKNKDAEVVRILKRSGQHFDLQLEAVNSDERPALLRRLEKGLPASQQIDSDVCRTLSGSSDRSYTEIWLRSLNQSPERKTLEPLQPGQLVGHDRFEVLRSIGVGGQGKAYLCQTIDCDDQLKSLVVLKETIIPVFADSSVRRNALDGFEKEARLLMDLNDESVVKLLDYFVEDHRAYLVLEHIDGSNLRQFVANGGAVSENTVIELAVQMCKTLRYLHGRSIVHRDFTPDNLILNSKNKLKLIDFNVAQNMQNGFSGTIVGKHAYLPPEQFRGQATEQSDLYAMGATLFYLLTAIDPEPISQSSPRKVNKDISEKLDAVVKRLTALQTKNRYACAVELEVDLLDLYECSFDERQADLNTTGVLTNV